MAGAAGMAVACAPFTQVNQAGLSLKRTDFSAYKFAPTPAAGVAKMKYDPMNKVVVLETLDGHFYKFDPMAPLPAAGGTATTATPTETSYPYHTPNHRGLAFGPDGTMYTLASNAPGNNNSVFIYKGAPGAGGGARTWSQLATSEGYPLPPANANNFGHSFSGLVVSPDGQTLYFSSGSRSDHGEQEGTNRELPITSAILQVPVTGANLTLPNNEAGLAPYFYADGTRNSYDLAYNANGDLIGADNGPDMDLPDEVNWLQKGKHYGFPWRFGAEDNPVLDSAYTPAGDMRLHTGYKAVDIMSYRYDATFPAPPTGVVFVDAIMNMGPNADFFRVGKTGPVQEASKVGMPIPGVTGHRSPLGLSFDVKGALCGAYAKQGFMASYGAFLSIAFEDSGQDLLLMQMNKGTSAYTMNTTLLVTGLKDPIDTVLVGNRLFLVGDTTTTPIYALVFPTPMP